MIHERKTILLLLSLSPLFSVDSLEQTNFVTYTLKIAVNTRFLIKDKLEGIGWFTYEAIKRLVLNHPEHEFIFLFDRTFDQEFIFADNVKGIKVSPPARHPLLWLWWFEKSVPKILKKENIDLFISTDGYLSLKTQVPTLLVIHDLAFEHYPNDVAKGVRNYYRKYTPKYAHKAKRIATVSQYSKNDIVEQYDISPSKIDVVYNGVNSIYKPSATEVIDSTKQQYSKGCDYFVYVGSIHPRKNIVNLFKAFDHFKEESKCDTKLLLVGSKGWSTVRIFEVYDEMTFKADVIFTDRVSSEELNKLLGASIGLTYVPYFEGFGIPIIEAQTCECPVITSKVTSMPEVAGDGALLVDPFSIDSIKNAMLLLKTNPEKRKELVEKGRANVERFSWDKTALALWNSVTKIKGL